MTEAPAFSHILDQLSALQEGSVTGGHLDLGPDIWLSCDPAGRAVMSCRPAEPGFKFTLKAGDSGAWACLGMRLNPETLRAGRSLGLMLGVESENLLCCTPTLRYFLKAGGMQDVPASAPVVLAPVAPASGAREHLSYIPLDADQLAEASGCELNLFFHVDVFAGSFTKLEPLLIR